ncbi:MAG: hypothetical protein COT33_00950 [Candidatus Nealsonbacteria bacterium CG08_land_8_20_14_0_20_38_20]|uniref:GHMP kinase N-terminal domain-containing protein n=1 Tax=Candidatus Nealsonbacteria bacterium CG08_land_8_20_14_0_20_38_20 TaxID=1974705 RepID=A0A2H0YPF4_9BACT|nr:MAG: hypothetical protein COT33_00950 [Candidatus Nealsonbacteria bacterium CG08_land_8_20_14_0_20_38_20]
MTLKIAVPLHITGFFAPQFSANPLLTGSVGAGLVITPGLVCVCKFSNKLSKSKVIYNGVETKIEPLQKLFDRVNFNKKVSIRLSSPVPLGFGYGVSGASTLAVSLALHRFLGKSNLKAAQLAHLAEVESLTGLGDALAIFSGRDLTVRLKPGAPGIGIVKSFSQPKNLRVITADLKRIKTKKMLKSMNQKTISLGQKILEKFVKNPSLENFFQYSQLFAKEIGWTNENFFKKLMPLKKQVFISSFSKSSFRSEIFQISEQRIRNKEYCIGFTVKKGVLFAVAEQNKLKNAVSILKKISPKIHIFKFGGGIKFSDYD